MSTKLRPCRRCGHVPELRFEIPGIRRVYVFDDLLGVGGLEPDPNHGPGHHSFVVDCGCQTVPFHPLHANGAIEGEDSLMHRAIRAWNLMNTVEED